MFLKYYINKDGSTRWNDPIEYCCAEHGNQVRCLKGELSPRWKGDSVGIHGVNKSVKKIYPKTELCQICKHVPPEHVACVGEYSRSVEKLDINWRWLCASCHTRWHSAIGDKKYSETVKLKNQSKLWMEFGQIRSC